MRNIEPIRVLQVFTILNRGGAETMIMNYYRHIDRTKVQFDFLVHREEPGAYEEEIKALGGRIYRLPPLYPRHFKKYKKEVQAFFKQHKEYKIIHGHISELGYFLYKEASRQQVPVIICHAHNSSMILDIKAPIRWYWKHVCRSVITDRFTCSPEAARWMFGNKTKQCIIQMNNAVDTDEFRFNYKKSDNIKKVLRVEDKIVLGHVGRFNEQKNHKFLIEFFGELNRQNNKTVLLLVGTGDLEDRIREQVKQLGIEKNVIFLGSRSDVSELLQAFDVFVFPSLFEGLPVTLIEAQAAGLPCLISDKISRNVDMGMNLIHYLPITQANIWVEEFKSVTMDIDKLRSTRTMDTSQMKKQGYDIEEEAKFIQQFYLEHSEGGAQV